MHVKFSRALLPSPSQNFQPDVRPSTNQLVVTLDPSIELFISLYFLLFISFTFNNFILCYIGENLAEQCKSIGMTSYIIEWYQLPSKNAMGLILIIVMFNWTVKLSAGKFVELSLASFCSVIKSALAYLSLLRTLI